MKTEYIIFKGKRILSDGSRVTVRGSGVYQDDKGRVFIFGYDDFNAYHEMEICPQTLKIERRWKFQE